MNVLKWAAVNRENAPKTKISDIVRTLNKIPGVKAYSENDVIYANGIATRVIIGPPWPTEKDQKKPPEPKEEEPKPEEEVVENALKNL